ncbi:Lipase (class 3) [Beggiatoa alba B18LD]|uniref:Lipase (Class 3) n=1 Tax=Beggiatoa alba B18LD TaxID=395493 RepID=I3CD58_9GAMM|nr:lipase class 3 [Beggiatoa alba]EIJ41551.1 Lipase (class 3) [Beggiatoa alba B18LD]
MFTPTQRELTFASMAFLTYQGEKIPVDNTTVFKIVQLINDKLPTVPSLNNDWRIVWGPALYSANNNPRKKKQANLTFVVQSISKPTQYIVATRGTVGDNLWEWITEDFEVALHPWITPQAVNPQPLINQATTNALKIVLNTAPPSPEQTPAAYKPLAGAGLTLVDFLASLTRYGNIQIGFTGHSLGAAISPALALWFKQSQGNVCLPHDNEIYPNMPRWDIGKVAQISCVSFAGLTIGDKGLTAYFKQQLGDNYDRIYNTLDIVPHAYTELSQYPSLYSPTYKMTLLEEVALEAFKLRVHEAQKKAKTVYEALPNSNPFIGTVNPSCKDYLAEAGYQHVTAYLNMFEVPMLAW